MSPSLDLTPAPRAAGPAARTWSQARYEFALLMRNGEQILLTLVIPLLVIVGLSRTSIVDLGSAAAGFARIQTVMPGVLTLAVLSSAFTAQAISVAFDRRYGVLRLLGTTPLGRRGLVAGKTCAIAAVVLGQVLILSVIGLLLGWHPHGSPLLAIVLIALGVAAFSGLALLMAGTLRAEATLAGANLVFVLLLIGGGIFIGTEAWPPAAAHVVQLLPTAALADGLRAVLRGGGIPAWHVWVVLLAWSVASIAAAQRFFRWD